MRIPIRPLKRTTGSVSDRVGSPTSSAGNWCHHRGHVGTCAACQRAQLARWRVQLAQAAAIRDTRRSRVASITEADGLSVS